jgi:TP901 family phage tail tape measure protein
MATALTATLRADITQFEKAITTAETKISGLSRSTTQVNNELKKFGNEFGGATLIRQANLMVKAVDDIGGVTKLTTAEQKKLSGSVDEALAKYRALGQEVPPSLVKISTELGHIKKAEDDARRSAEALGAAQKRAAEEAAKAQADFANNIQNVGSGLTKVGAVLTAGLTVPIVAGFGLSVKAAKDFESAFANVIKTVDGLDVDNFGKLNNEAQKLRGEIRNLAKELPIAVEDLSNIAAIGGQFGVSRAALLDFTETVAKLGVAVDGISSDEAAASLAQIGKIAGVTEGEFNNLASSVVALGNAGNSTEGAILEMSKRFASAGTAAGLSAAEIAGVSAALSNVGVDAEAGGTALSKTFNEMSAAVAKGGKDLEAFAKIAGISSKVFADTFKKDAVAAFDLFLGGLNKAVKGGQDFTILLEGLGITEVRQANAIRSLALNYTDFAKTVDLSSKAFKENTALNEEARKKFATFENQLKLFKNQINDIGIELGGPLLEGLRSALGASQPLIDGIAALARGFAAMSDEAQLAIVGLGAIGATGGPLLLIAGSALRATVDVVEFTKAIRAMGVASAAAGAAGASGGIVGLATSIRTAAAGASAAIVGSAGLLASLSAAGLAAVGWASSTSTAMNEVVRAAGGPLGLAIANLTSFTAAANDAAKAAASIKVRTTDIQLPSDSKTAKPDTAAAAEAVAKLEDLSKEAKKRASEIQAIVDKATGATVQREIAQIASAFEKLSDAQRANATIVKALLEPYEKFRQETNVLPIALEKARAELQKPLAARNLFETTSTQIRQVGNEIKAFTTSIPKIVVAPNVSNWAIEAKNHLNGLRRDGLLPVSQSFAQIIEQAPSLGDAINTVAVQSRDGLGALVTGVTEIGHASDGFIESLKSMSDEFANLAQIGGEGLEGFTKQLGELVTLMGIAGSAGAQLKNLFSVDLKNSSGEIVGQKFSLNNFKFNQGQGGLSNTQVAANYLSAGTAAVAGGQAIAEATNVKGRGNRAARGAASGAALGLQIAGPYGALAGAAIGALVGAFRNPAFEDVYKRVAKNFGVAISDETAKAIAKTAKDTFKGDRAAAEIFSLDTIIAEGGGIKDSNVKQLQARLRDAFSMKDVGKFSKEQLDEVLEKNFGAFASYVTQQTTIASQGFSEILRLAKDANATTEEMRQFVSGQAGVIGGGLSALAGPLAEQAAAAKTAQDQIKAAQQAADQARGAAIAAREGKSDADLGVGDRERVAAAEQAAAAAAEKLAELTANVGEGAKGAQAEFDRLGVVALAGFNAARESGLGFLESLDQIGPGLDQLVGIQQSLGLESNAALAELLKFRELVGQNETLVASAEALNETVRALSNIGGLTTESLAAMEGQGLQTFERLTAAGFSNNQALELMAGFLENVKLAHEQLGTPIDENTAKLIEQAEAQGILKDAANDTNSILKEGIGALIEAVGGRLPEAWKKAAQAAKDAASATNRSTDAAEQAVRDQERVIDSGSGAWEDYKDSGVLSQEEIRKEIEKTGDKLRNDFPTEIKIKVRFDVEDAPEMPSGSVGGSGFAYIPPGTVTGPDGESVGTGGSSPQLPGQVNSSIDVPAIAAQSNVIQNHVYVSAEIDKQPILRLISRELPRHIETRTGQRTAA